jgi:hypothetical protein
MPLTTYFFLVQTRGFLDGKNNNNKKIFGGLNSYESEFYKSYLLLGNG